VIGHFDQFDAIAVLEVSHLTDLGEGFGAAAVAHEHLGAIAEFGLAIRICHLSFLSRTSPARGRASGFTRRRLCFKKGTRRGAFLREAAGLRGGDRESPILGYRLTPGQNPSSDRLASGCSGQSCTGYLRFMR